MSTETWYVLEDGSCCHPQDVVGGAKGVLRHKDGRAVAYRPDGETPRSRSVDADAERAKAEPQPEKKEPKPTKASEKQVTSPRDRQVKAGDDDVKYKTR